MSRSRLTAGVILVLTLAALGYAGYQNYLAPVPATPTKSEAFVTGPNTPEVVTAEGKIVPANDATLAFRLSARVAEILVQEGDTVEAGQTLIQLENADTKAAVAQAEAAVAQAQAGVALAQANLDEILAGPRPEEIAAAEAQVKAAGSAVGQAVAQRDDVKKGATQDQVAAAQAQLAQAQAQQKEAQNAYDQIIDNKIRGWIEEQSRFKVIAANEAVAAAQAALDQVLAGAGEETIRAYNNAVGVAASQRAAAEAQLALLKAGATKAQIDAVRARLDQAQAALQAAQASLDAANAQLAQTVLAAPFAGKVVSLNAEVGEVVTPGAPVLVVADLSRWRMKTTDLSETDVVLVRPGQPAVVTLDAFADRSFHGVVTEISDLSETNRGNTTYAVTIDLDPTDAPMRWGMTAFVDIQVGP